MKRLMLMLLIATVLLPGCASSSQTTEMTLEQAAYQENDLPEGYAKGEVRQTVADSFEEISLPQANESVYITLESTKPMGDAQRGGNINLLLFDTPDDSREAYKQLSQILLASTGEIEDVPGLGDQSAMARFELKPVIFTNIAFTRCNAVVYLLLTDEHQVAVDYLKKVDNRLKESACP